MNIVGVYAEDYPWDVRVEKLLRGFATIGCEPSLLCRNLKRRPTDEVVDGIACRRVLGPNAPGVAHGLLSLPAPANPVWRRALDRLVVERRPALLVVRDLPLSMLVIEAGRRHGVPVLVDMAENHPAMWANVGRSDSIPMRSWLLKNPGLARRLERRVAAEADRIFVVVDEMKDHLVSIGGSPDRIDVVSNTPPLHILDAAEADPAAGGDALELVYVGHITRSRGLQNVIGGMAAAGADHPETRFHVVGTGPYLEALRIQAAASGLGERVVFHGWVDNAKVPELTARCNVGVIPHLKTEHTDTTVPNKLFDYMAVGLPVLVSDAAPMERIATREQCGVAFRSGDAGSFAAGLGALADPEVRVRFGRTGRAAVRDRYHWERDLERVLAVLGEMTGAEVAGGAR